MFNLKILSYDKESREWMYSTLGSIFATTMLKLSPIHRRLSELEIRNLRDYFNSDFVPKAQRKQLSVIVAFWMSFFGAIYRTIRLSPKARQDYYALNRQGRFSTQELPEIAKAEDSSSEQKLPVVIVPGLNTPTVFFREMYEYFSNNGYAVHVVSLPEKGLSDVASSAKQLLKEIQKVQTVCEVGQVHVIGHCMGGLIAKYTLDTYEGTPIKTLVSLGTGFTGAEGVQNLKDIWMKGHPNQPVPQIFDELIQWNKNLVRQSANVVYHSFLTVWDMMVHFRKGFLSLPDYPELQVHPASSTVHHHLIDDPAIDHLTLVLSPKMFSSIETVLKGEKPSESFLLPSG